MKFKFCYEKIFKKTIHEEIDLICVSINETQNEDIISCYIIDISVFESNLNEICRELEKTEDSGLDGQVWGGKWIEFRKKKIPENYEEYEEIIEVD